MYKCNKCGEYKSETEFYSYERCWCKVCRRADAKRYRDSKNNKNENIEDNDFKKLMLEKLFPTGNIPEKFKKRYL
jgi:hypothetical protein